MNYKIVETARKHLGVIYVLSKGDVTKELKHRDIVEHMKKNEEIVETAIAPFRGYSKKRPEEFYSPKFLSYLAEKGLIKYSGSAFYITAKGIEEVELDYAAS